MSSRLSVDDGAQTPAAGPSSVVQLVHPRAAGGARRSQYPPHLVLREQVGLLGRQRLDIVATRRPDERRVPPGPCLEPPGDDVADQPQPPAPHELLGGGPVLSTLDVDRLVVSPHGPLPESIRPR